MAAALLAVWCISPVYAQDASSVPSGITQLTGPIAAGPGVGSKATSIASQTGTGTKFVVDTNPVIQTSLEVTGSSSSSTTAALAQIWNTAGTVTSGTSSLYFGKGDGTSVAPGLIGYETGGLEINRLGVGNVLVFTSGSSIQFPTLTASSPLYLDSSKNLTNTAPAGYSKVLSATSSSIGGSPLLVGTCTNGTVTVTGATTGMAIVATPAAYPGDGFDWSRSYVSSSNTITVQVCADVAGTPTASAYNVRIIQ